MSDRRELADRLEGGIGRRAALMASTAASAILAAIALDPAPAQTWFGAVDDFYHYWPDGEPA